LKAVTPSGTNPLGIKRLAAKSACVQKEALAGTEKVAMEVGSEASLLGSGGGLGPSSGEEGQPRFMLWGHPGVEEGFIQIML